MKKLILVFVALFSLSLMANTGQTDKKTGAEHCRDESKKPNCGNDQILVEGGCVTCPSGSKPGPGGVCVDSKGNTVKVEKQ